MGAALCAIRRSDKAVVCANLRDAGPDKATHLPVAGLPDPTLDPPVELAAGSSQARGPRRARSSAGGSIPTVK